MCENETCHPGSIFPYVKKPFRYRRLFSIAFVKIKRTFGPIKSRKYPNLGLIICDTPARTKKKFAGLSNVAIFVQYKVNENDFAALKLETITSVRHQHGYISIT